MAFGLNTALVALLGLVPLGIGMALAVLAARALLKYIRSKDARQERVQVKRSLGEALRARRTACKMTQEFVAEALGVRVSSGMLLSVMFFPPFQYIVIQSIEIYDISCGIYPKSCIL